MILWTSENKSNTKTFFGVHENLEKIFDIGFSLLIHNDIAQSKNIVIRMMKLSI